MNDRRAFSLINIIRNIVSIYFDTFFAIYFFNLTNYAVFPIALYYFLVYSFLLLSFWLIRKTIYLKYKVSYYRIGLALMALYLSTIMLLKENIIHYIYLVAALKGLSEGFYYYPRNILNSDKISNKERKHYDGIMNAINQISSILVPLILGVLLNSYTYIEIGKVVFALMILIFILSFYVKEKEKKTERIKTISFYKMISSNKDIMLAFKIQFLRGFTIASGVLTAVMMIYKIIYFKNNLSIGILNSILGLLTFLSSLFYARNKKNSLLNKMNFITLFFTVISLILLFVNPNDLAFFIYLIIYAIGITIISLLCDKITTDASNIEIVLDHKAEYHLLLETALGISRIGGYLVLLLVSIFGNVELLKYFLLFSIVPIIVLVLNIRGYLVMKK